MTNAVIINRGLAIALFGVLATSSTALAQSASTTTTPVATDPAAGSFDKLSAGNQKIAQALFDAQVAPASTKPTTGTTPGATTTPKRLTRDQIAALKLGGRGWGAIFHDMQAKGLVTEKNLGQIVRDADRPEKADRDRPDKLDRSDRGRDRADRADSRGRGFTDRAFSRDFIEHGNAGAASPTAHGGMGNGNGAGRGHGHGRR